MSLINIGVAGLRVQQTALSVTGQNITNANTEGYSRQRIGVVPQNAGTDGTRFRGAGATVSNIERITDAYVVEQVRSDNSMQAEMAALSSQIGAIDGLLFSETNGLDGAFDQFFSALNDANAAPDSITERNLVLEAGSNLAGRFSSLNDQLASAERGVTEQLGSTVGSINELAAGIAQLNGRLAEISDPGLSGSENSLLDQRDVLLKELSALVSVKVVEQDGAQISVFVGKGQALVFGTSTQTLAVGSNQQILLRGNNGVAQAITNSLSGGVLGGALGFREEVLVPATQRLGQLAHSFVQQFNAEHKRGLDLEGLPGRDFFADVNSGNNLVNRVQREDLGTSESGAIRVEIIDAQQTRLSDYRLDFPENGNGTFSIRRLSDGVAVHQGRFTASEQVIEFDGVRVSMAATGFAQGQSYRLSPLGSGAGDVRLQLNGASEIALASAARSEASVSNFGSGVVNAGAVVDPDHPILQGDGSLTPPLLVRFTAADRFDLLDNSDPTAPKALDPPLRSVRYQAGRGLPEALATPGSTRLVSSTPEVGRINDIVDTPLSEPLPGNGYGQQQLLLNNAGTETSIAVPAEASAAATAALLDRLPGVSATAYTDVSITSIDARPGDPGPSLVIDGEMIDNIVSLDDLVSRVNANVELADRGIRAALDADGARLTDINGEDLDLRLSGATGSGLALLDSSGQASYLAGSGQGDAAVIDGAADLRAGHNFSAGGPFTLTVSTGSSTGQVSLSSNFTQGADLVNEIQDQLDAGLGPDRVQASLNSQGQLRLVTNATGATANLVVSPNTALGTALGLTTSSSQGTDRYQGTTVGGQVAVLLDPETTLQAQGAGPFAQDPLISRGDLGFELSITGNPLAGDEFGIVFNRDGSLDNRNGLSLSGLQSADLIGDPATSVNEAFAGLIEFVGSRASQAASDQEAAASLLAQSEARQSSISGVNLDEEAANLIRHEQGYNAAAQIISVARDVFNVLINAVS
ncbi:MAG: flagellar hook-associated protein FlgK [Pseudomonadales bacterium]